MAFSRRTFQGRTYPAMLMLDSSMFQQYDLFSRLMKCNILKCCKITISSSSNLHILLSESNLSALIDSSERKAVAMWKNCLDEDLLHVWSDISTGSLTFQGAVKSR